MFESWSLNRKLVSSFGLVAVILGGVGGFSYYSLNRTVTYFGHVADINLPNATQLSEMKAGQKDVIIVVESLVDHETTQKAYEDARLRIATANKTFDDAAKAYLAIEFVEGEEAKWSKVDAAWKTLVASTDKILTLSSTGKKEDFEARDAFAHGAYAEERGMFREAITDLIAFQHGEAKKWSGEAESHAASSLVAVSAAVAAGFLLALALGLLLARSLSRAISGVTDSLAKGAEQVAAAAHQISSSNESLSANGTEQAAALQETASALDEVNAMVKQNAENATRSRGLASQSQDAATRGQSAVNTMLGAVEEMSRSNADVMRQVEASNREIAEIAGVIADIGNKTKVINDIVFQTKLLSFNASVEAARAGEHGKGFAVVAEEVGNLAQMSGNASKEIASMLEGSIQRVNTIVAETKRKVETLIESGRTKAEQGSEMARRCSEVFGEIVTGITQVTGTVAEIASASQEQARGVSEITRAISEMDQVTQRNSVATEQAASAAVELSAQAESLIQVVRTLEQTVHGHALATPAAGASMPAAKPQTRATGHAVKAAPVVRTHAEKAPTPVVKMPARAPDDIPDKDRFLDVA